VAKSYKDLVVWQKAMDLSIAVYQMTRTFPKEEIFGLTSQMRRAAVSITSNIAEGEGRKSRREFAHFLGIALGSKAELETQLILSEKIGLAKREDSIKAHNLLNEIGKMLTCLKQKQDGLFYSLKNPNH
jgi:four helix bundle protein